jgi:hypothetical protein
MKQEKKDFNVTIEFYGRKYKATVKAMNKIDANAIALSSAKAKIRIINEDGFDHFMGDFETMLGESLNMIKEMDRTNKKIKESLSIMENTTVSTAVKKLACQDVIHHFNVLHEWLDFQMLSEEKYK